MCKLGMKVTHKVMGIITNNVGIMDFNENETKFTFDIRYPVGFDFDFFKEPFTNILNIYGISYEIVEQKEPHYIDSEDFLVKTLYNSYVKYSGDTKNKPKSIGGGTYARTIENAVAYGPNFLNRPDICHQPDEHIYLEDFVKWIAIYAKAIYLLAK